MECTIEFSNSFVKRFIVSAYVCKIVFTLIFNDDSWMSKSFIENENPTGKWDSYLFETIKKGFEKNWPIMTWASSDFISFKEFFFFIYDII